MKAEHRHELKTNALADTLGRLLQGLKSGPSRHSLLVWGLVALAVVVGLTGYFIYQSNKESRSHLWTKVDDGQRKLDGAATDDEVQTALDDLKKEADANPDTPQARVLRFDRARTLLRLGTERRYADREKALGYLKDARDLYAGLAAELSGKDKEYATLRQEALMGVAQANENLGDLDEALKGYQALAGSYPKGALGEAAKKRAEYLEDETNRKRVKELQTKLDELANPPTRPAEKPQEKK